MPLKSSIRSRNWKIYTRFLDCASLFAGFSCVSLEMYSSPNERETMHKIRKSLLMSALAACLVSGSIGPTQAVEVVQVPAGFTITGSGFGHGVGMSQYGAQGMALDKAKYTAEQILTHYYTGTTVDSISIPNSNIRVGLYQDKVFVALKGELVPGATSGGGFNITVDGSAPLPISLGAVITLTTVNGLTKVSSGGVTIGSGSKVTISWTNTDTVINIGTGADSATAISALGIGTCIRDLCSHRFRYGTLEIQSGAFDDKVVDLVVVNTLRLMDEYLYGLGEVPSYFEDAAMQAQAIAGRSYALKKTATRSGCNCQIYSTIRDQSFVGFSKEIGTLGSRWVAAVNATIVGPNEAKVVRYKGSVISTYYSSSTGGKTQPTSEVWGSAFPYLVSVDDHWSQDEGVLNGNSSWTDTIDQLTLVSNLRAQGVTIADVSSITVADNYPSGGIKTLNLVDSAGNITTLTIAPGQKITPDELRGVLGTKSTYISAITAGIANVPASPTVTAKELTSVTKVNWPTKVIEPTDFSFTGKVSPAQLGATIKLQRKISGKWKTVSKATTNDRGSWSIIWTEPSAGNHDLQITATNSKGTIATSTKRVVMAGSIVTSAPKTAKRNSAVTISGSVKPGYSGVVITIQRKIGNGPWKNIGTAKTTASGKWTMAHSAGSKKTLVYYRAISRDARLGVVTSKTKKTQVK